ncbi:hypothetical protein PISMIDRAFT_196723 [Pisolithus microcarpus 441]|uniref:Uncharacterized protein n=1 Tax=Pisolithus microcarpus 441 TaxID=765257 RepID=A0A0C9YN64_9AGAM|nr:hypothetical protein PISMIDRAFT_196723 [Pisolithus microcarpus 441]
MEEHRSAQGVRKEAEEPCTCGGKIPTSKRETHESQVVHQRRRAMRTAREAASATRSRGFITELMR